jgi:hypothetical protein
MKAGGGLSFIVDADGKAQEGETFTCFHCQRLTMVPHKARPEDVGGLCYVCYRHICPNCVGKPCDPFEEKLKRMEASYHARRSYGFT